MIVKLRGQVAGRSSGFRLDVCTYRTLITVCSANSIAWSPVIQRSRVPNSMPPATLLASSRGFIIRSKHHQQKRCNQCCRRLASTQSIWRGQDPLTRHGQSITGSMEWQTSAYSFNKQGVKNLPATAATVEKLIQAFMTMRKAGSGKRDSHEARMARTRRRMGEEQMYVSRPTMRDFGDHIELSAFVYDGKKGARGPATDSPSTDLIMEPIRRKGLESLVTRLYGKPVAINLTPLSKPHLDADILAAVVAQRLRDRTNTPRRVIRDATWRAPLPSAKTIVAIQQKKQKLSKSKLAWQDFTMKSAARTTATSISEGLVLSQVSSVEVEAAGRLTKRLTANRSQRKMARRGASAKGPAVLLRGFRKAHIQRAFATGKRRVGQFGIQVALGHT